ncbi:hypothetical protein SAMN03159423_5569 [Bradyrhizobium sp. NFR13]|uniref:DUF6634 family protein n=1 Tax=Bradyrhizobium sp. NFR13 TaxID=1566285 RepID=UPI0008F048F7|nr:hypothetical protein SAMN03159423_5569 [Bradyrhizobium sp. NFR13]
MSIITPYGSLNSLQDSLTSLLGDIRDLRTEEIPCSMDLRVAPIIDKWSYSLIPAGCIAGSVHGHPILGNCAHVHTSQLILIDPENGWARTWSRYYRLGACEERVTGSRTS